MSFLDSVSKIHVVGAGGIGVSAAAKLLKHLGKEVSGSDIAANEATAELEAIGISVVTGHAAKNVPADADLLLYSDAVPPENPERAEAARRGLREMSYFDFLGAYSREKRTVAVSGTNGKSTTTALLALMLEAGGFDPTVIVGSRVRTFSGGNFRPGSGDLFVVEACEHHANMLKLAPQAIVLTNIEADHLDFYGDLDHIKAAFQQYVDSLPVGGLLTVNVDDPVIGHELRLPTGAVSYGLDNPADYRLVEPRVQAGHQVFRILQRGVNLGEFILPMPGRFNLYNALAAATAALELGASAEAVHDALARFPGLWRRFEKIGERDGSPVYSDYGHHPTAVAATIAAAREFHPGRRIVLAFQPHQHNRTRNLFDDFVAAFDGADALVLAEVYDVAGREESADAVVSSRDLLRAVRQRDAVAGRERDVAYAESPVRAQAELENLTRSGDVIIVMGAGDIYRIAPKLVNLT
ncbi:MAG: UDP-N-acetylmuramate--L-alanine ligase [Patescibacteria group bacterium]|nr:UDP-N-acetylmuramate--L-alanine ligase [Patescibacteria group bacterium]